MAEVVGNPFDFLLQAIEDTNRGDAVLELPRRPFIEQRLQGGAAPRAPQPEVISPAPNKKNKMSPYDTARANFNFPFELRAYQAREVNRLSQGDHHIFTFEGDGEQGDGEHTGHYDEPGTGKTAISTHQALYQMVVNGIDQWIVLMPPILIPQWGRWLRSITRKETGLSPTVTEYRGNPKQRAKLSLDSNFLLMSYAMFKNDIEKLWTHLDGRRVATGVSRRL